MITFQTELINLRKIFILSKFLAIKRVLHWQKYRAKNIIIGKLI